MRNDEIGGTAEISRICGGAVIYLCGSLYGGGIVSGIKDEDY